MQFTLVCNWSVVRVGAGTLTSACPLQQQIENQLLNECLQLVFIYLLQPWGPTQ